MGLIRKITNILLTFTLLLVATLTLAPKLFAQEENYNVNLTVYTESGLDNAIVNSAFQGPFGTSMMIDLSGLQTLYEKDDVFFVFNGQLINDMNYHFLISGSSKIHAFLKNEDQTVAVFVDTNGTLLDVQYTVTAVLPEIVPSKPGYTFTGFTPDVGSISEDTVFVANYELENTSEILIDVVGGTTDKPSYIYNEVVTLNPNTLVDFAYWSDTDGNVISTHPNFQFSALVNTEVVAVYDDEFIPMFNIYLTDVTGIREDRQSFMGYINNPNPSTFEVVEFGILASDEIDEALTLETPGVIIATSSALAPTNEFLRSFNNNQFNSFRGYVIYKESGIQKVTYSSNNFTSVVIEEPVNFEENLKVLAIGNSFSVDALTYLSDIALDYGVQNVVLGHLYSGGASLQDHADKTLTGGYYWDKFTNGVKAPTGLSSLIAGLQNEDWDVIVVQQQSGKSGVESTYDPYLEILLDFIEANKPKASTKVVWHLTWAYAANSTHEEFVDYNNNQKEMYQDIISTYQSKINNNLSIDHMIPTGTAIQNARTSFIGDNVTRDGYHLNEDGQFIAGLTWFKAITGLSIDNITYRPAQVTEDELVTMKEAVNNALETPLAVTQSTNNYIVLNSYLNYVTGYYAAPNTTLAANNNFITTQYRMSKATLPVGSILELVGTGYRYRANFWNANLSGGVQHPWLGTTGKVVITEAWWGSYEFVTFSISTTLGVTDLSEQVAAAADKLKIYVPGPITHISGFWYPGQSSVHQNIYYANYIASTRIPRMNFNVGTVVTVAPGYTVTLSFHKPYFGSMAIFNTVSGQTGTFIVDATMWGDNTYVTYYIQASPTAFLHTQIANVPNMISYLPT